MARYELRLKAAQAADCHVHHACVLSSDTRHRITQINQARCEGWVDIKRSEKLQARSPLNRILCFWLSFVALSPKHWVWRDKVHHRH